ncbi:TonB-dependent receptor domain-containing protein [Thalassobius sp. Cn5-15]|uniref:TonB-dependent receptor domain-containing protein n=1 Tax=Thalassobius sp. Cn5-15 TaxID=2917763 RepID=UPI001EF34A63|nr:TonB-dependent receptor [Thalassobius sp. Cn5-15]MCG7495176.1 TonB-dependent receptor [Thalassobius sp. Cn5-15]
MKRNSTIAVAVAGLTALPALSGAVLAQDINQESDDVIQLDAIQLNASRRGVQTDTATSKTVIDQEEIEARQATSFGELLDSVPNVNLINGSLPQGSAVNIRGLGGQAGFYGTDGKVAVVVDGVASGAEEIYRNGSLLALEPELFREVAVTRGPSESFRYSSGAFGGTIEAETKDATDFLQDGDTFSLRQKFGYESNGDGLLSTTILSFAPNDRFDALAFFGYRDVGESEDGDGETRRNTDFEGPSGLVKLNYKLTDDATLTFGHTRTVLPETDVPYNAQDPDWNGVTVDRDTEDRTTYLSLNYDPVDNNLIDLEVFLYHKFEKLKIAHETLTSGIFNADHETESLGLRLENVARFVTGAVDHEFTTGIEVKRRERSAELLSGTYAGRNDASAPGGFDRSVSFYIADKMEIGDKLTLTPQLRYESQELESQNNIDMQQCFGPTSCRTSLGLPDGTTYDANAWTGALSARYAVTDEFAVFGSAAYNENLPILDDLRSTTNREKSEKATTFELGASYDGTDVVMEGDHLQAKLTAFRTEIWDGTSYSGIDETDLEGVELELNYASDLFYADFAAARTRGNINGTAAPFNYTPADTVQLTLGKKFLDEQLDVAVEAKHAFAHSRTTSTSGATAPSEDWTTYALSVGYKPDNGALEGTELRLGIENLFDETYRPFLTSPNRNAKGRNIKFTLAKTF